MEEHATTQPTSRRKNSYIIGGILLFVVLAFFMMKKGLLLPFGRPEATPTPQTQSQSAIDGKMFLASTQGKKVFRIGEDIVLDLRIDTVRQEIGGYDAVMNYDRSMLEFISATNLVKDFEMFRNVAQPTSDTESTVTITGIMKLDSQTPYAFQQDPVARLVFKAKKNGLAKIAFMFTKGETNDSNLVLLDTQEILGAVEDFSFSVANVRNLGVGKSYTEPQSSLMIKVDKITTPPANCNDCTTDAMFTFSLKGKTQSAIFSNGGIAGKLVDSQNILGFIVEVENITEKSVQVSVVPAK